VSEYESNSTQAHTEGKHRNESHGSNSQSKDRIKAKINFQIIKSRNESEVSSE
jgi:hypothetical protein